jgi:hypothetical protein|tara:strand:+ start:73316 stop:74485 length:1170 start_codon:yes stop_codon:yes gene_type:complete
LRGILDKKGDLMKGKTLILSIFVFLVLNVSVLAQGLFDYGRGFGGRSSGFSNLITDTLDFIFGGIVEPLMDAVRFNNFHAAIKLALWIILYIVLAWLAGNYFGDKVPKKLSKVIAVIAAFMGVVFIPERLLEVLFRDLLGGLVGYLLFTLFIVLPIYWLYKWSKDSENRTVNLVSAGGFFLMMNFITYLNREVVFEFNYGIMHNLASTTVMLGTLAALIFFFHRLFKGLKSKGGDETPTKKKEEDKFAGAKALANKLVNELNKIGEHLDQLSNDPDGLANDLSRHHNQLNVINRTFMTHLNSGVHRLESNLSKADAKDLASEIVQEYNDLHDSVERFTPVRKNLDAHLRRLRSNQPLDQGYFTDLIGKIGELDSEIKQLVKSLLKINSL